MVVTNRRSFFATLAAVPMAVFNWSAFTIAPTPKWTVRKGYMTMDEYAALYGENARKEIMRLSLEHFKPSSELIAKAW